MKRGHRHATWVATALVVAAALSAAAGRIWAQQAPLSGGVSPGAAAQARHEEGAIQIIPGPGGKAYRVWERVGDEMRGGGRVYLARWEEPGTWRSLLQIAPPEPGVSALSAAFAASPAGQLAVTYRWRQHQPRSKQIRLAVSSDGGSTWQLPSQPIDTSEQAFESRVAWGKGKTLVVAWDDERRSSRAFDVYARRSTDGGASWEPEQLLSRFPSQLGSDIYARPRMAGDGGDRFYVLWVGVRNVSNHLFLSRSEDGGRTWGDPISVGGKIRSVFGHSIHLVGDRLFVLWLAATDHGDRLFSATSTDRGLTWTPPTPVQHLPAERMIQVASPSALVMPDGETLVAWHDSRNGRFDVYLSRSTDGGRTWGSEDLRLDTDDAGTAHSRYPRFARSADGRVAVTWEDDREGWEGAYARIRAGSTWGPEIRVAGPDRAKKKGIRLPQALWVGDRDLHVSWETWDYSGGTLRIAREVEGKTIRLEGRAGQ